MGENTRRQPSGGSSEQERQPWLGMMVKFGSATAHWALILGGVALIIVLGAIALGKTQFDWLPNIQAAVAFFLILGFIGLFFKLYESLAPGWVALVLAIGLYVGGPYLVGILAKVGKLAADESFVTNATKSFVDLGLFLGVAAAIRLLIGFYLHLATRQQTTRTRMQYMDLSKEDSSHIGFIPKCWQMSRCRPAVRMSCPNYIDRHTCWSRRSGCFCDRELANYLLQSVDAGESSEVTDVAQAAVSRGVPPVRGAKRPWKLQKTLCYNCPLFIEHQEYKFKHLRWVSLPITLAIGAGLWPFFDAGFKWLSEWLTVMTTKMVELGNLPDNFRPDVTQLDMNFEIFLGVVILVLISSFVMEFTERMFLKWNL